MDELAVTTSGGVVLVPIGGVTITWREFFSFFIYKDPFGEKKVPLTFREERSLFYGENNFHFFTDKNNSFTFSTPKKSCDNWGHWEKVSKKSLNGFAEKIVAKIIYRDSLHTKRSCGASRIFERRER